jgi:hypothetical protein
MSASTWKISESRKSPGWLVIIGPYDAAFVEDLKAAVHPRDREWMPTAKAWKVRATRRAEVEKLIALYTEAA